MLRTYFDGHLLLNTSVRSDHEVVSPHRRDLWKNATPPRSHLPSVMNEGKRDLMTNLCIPVERSENVGKQKRKAATSFSDVELFIRQVGAKDTQKLL